MSDKKILNIDPNLFSLSGGTTRKKRPPTPNTKIKIKNAVPKSKIDSLKKKSILKMIRQHQADKYKKMVEDNKTKNDKANIVEDDKSKFESRFEQSKEYLSNLIETNEQKERVNRTLKSYPVKPASLLFHPIMENTNTVIPEISNTISTNLSDLQPMQLEKKSYPLPQYGCMKGGNLPTYRDYMNKTQKNSNNGYSSSSSNTYPQIHIQPQQSMNATSNYVNVTNTGGSNNTNNLLNNNLLSATNQLSNNINTQLNEPTTNNNSNMNAKKITEMRYAMDKLQAIKNQNQIKRMKQKRTIRRTYKVGKSKVQPKISVLVSNRTIRNNITTKAQLLKQESIPEIKRYLIKHGFIKVGTTAPNDVLRKIYESALLICGEVKNHNPDNLLFNYLNDKESQ